MRLVPEIAMDKFQSLVDLAWTAQMLRKES